MLRFGEHDIGFKVSPGLAGWRENPMMTAWPNCGPVNEGNNMRIKLNEERKSEIAGALSDFYANEFGENLSAFRATTIVDFLLLKIIGALICSVCLWFLYKRFRKIALVITSGVIAFYSAVLIWNVAVTTLV